MIENGGNVMAGRGFEINDFLPQSGDSHRSEGIRRIAELGIHS